MIETNGFTASEATALCGAHTIGFVRNSFGPSLAGPWVLTGADEATANGPVFDNSYHDFLINTIAEDTSSAFANNTAPFDRLFPDWFRDEANGLDQLL